MRESPCEAQGEMRQGAAPQYDPEAASLRPGKATRERYVIKRLEERPTGKRWGWLEQDGRKVSLRQPKVLDDGTNRQWLEGYKPAASCGDPERVLRAHSTSLTPVAKYAPMNLGGPSPLLEIRMDHLRLMWVTGVGAAIVVGGRESLSQGEGPQSSRKLGGQGCPV